MNIFGLGVDLGQVNDPAALLLIEKTSQPASAPGKEYAGDILQVRFAELMPLRTSYPDVVRRVLQIIDSPQLKGKCDLVVDHTGVGRAPVDMMREAGMNPLAISITSGGIEQRAVVHTKSTVSMDQNVPKKELIAILRRLLESRPQRIQIAASMKDADLLTKQLSTFAQKINKNGRASYEALREKDHDDLVLALGLVAWNAVRDPKGPIIALKPGVMTEEWLRKEGEKIEKARARTMRIGQRLRTDPDFHEDFNE